MDYETIIRNSNTIFSTMICPECRNKLYFEKIGENIGAKCYGNCDFVFSFTIYELCALLNHNGINFLMEHNVTYNNPQDI